jgi:rhamnulose-1-phosphate aldolase/alcohol dehydrogenase
MQQNPTIAPAPTDALDSLVHYSQMLGQDESLVLRGGGNTSVKTRGTDLADRAIDVLLVKGTGSDLKQARARDFPALRLADLLLLRERDDMTDEDMVAYIERCKLDPSAPRPSIEALLHAFVPAPAVFHSHADAILALSNTPNPEIIVLKALGEDVACVPYRRPGFRLSRAVGEAATSRGARAVVLLNHGLVTWGPDPAAAYQAHLEIVKQAQEFVRARTAQPVFVSNPAVARLDADARRRFVCRLAPVLRGVLSAEKRVLLAYDDTPQTLAFVGSAQARQASAAGAATPDHILTTKNLPLWLDLDPARESDVAARVSTAVAAYRSKYLEYFDAWKTNEPQLEPRPRIILVPGIGLFAAGRDLRTAQVAREIYRHTIGIMAGAESLGGYRSLSEQEAFRAEYWPLELYKLALAPPERELERRIALVTGAGSGIGKAIAVRLAEAGAHVIVTDLDAATATSTSELIQRNGGNATPWPLDVTRESAVEETFDRAAVEFGGVDLVVSNAGFAHSAPIERLELSDWQRSFAVNATAHFLVSRAALRLLRRQAIGGSIIFVVTKNVTAPGADFAAYSSAKAAESQLARVAAIEGGPIGVRVNMVNPDAVFTDTHLWDDIRQERARAHRVPIEEIEQFYRRRSLLGVEVRPIDVAEAVLFLASDRSSRTTGCVIPVDGGVREAFLR